MQKNTHQSASPLTGASGSTVSPEQADQDNVAPQTEPNCSHLYDQVEERNVELAIANAELQQTIEQLWVAKEELKQQNLELEAERFKYQALFNFAPDGYLVTNAAGVIQSANQAIAHLLGVEPHFLVGQPLSLYVALADQPLLDLQLHPRQIETVEISLQPRQGKAFPAEVTVAPQYNEAQAVIGLRWLVRDISQRKQTETTIRQQAQRETLLREITQRIRQSLDLQTIFDIACEDIRQLLQADRVGIFKFSPESGFDEGEFVAESVVSEFPSLAAIRVHDKCFGKNYAALYVQGRFYVADDINRRDAIVCPTDILPLLEVRANVVMPLLCGDNLWGLLCIHQCATPRHWQPFEIDLAQQLAQQLSIAIQQTNLVTQLQQELTERQQAEAQLTHINQELAYANQELARATHLKDEFLANMSHELRTPLNAILGLSEGLQEEVFGFLNDRQKKAIATVERSGQHLLELINDILDVSKIAAGKLELDFSTVSISALCHSSLVFVKEQAHKKQIQLHTHFPNGLSPVALDERRLRQALINLLSNAVKFTPTGGRVTLDVYLEPVEINLAERIPLCRSALQKSFPSPQGEVCSIQDYTLCIAVQDTGIGIAATEQDKLFQPFIQLDSSLNRQYEGTGLGLTLVKQIAELHSGSVTLHSELGQGSCFTLRLPYLQTLPPQHDIHPEAAAFSPLSSSPLSSEERMAPLILLAEDNEANISTISSYLSAKNYRMIIAHNGEEAIALATAHQPDLILMDIQMPGIDGLEAIQALRRRPNLLKCPIIALTALAMNGDRERCIKAGANDYLTKPVKMSHLVTTIQELLAVREEL